jgi:hypothetical protein
MRNYIFICFIATILTACTQNSGSDKTNIKSEQKIRKQATAIAENFVKEKLKDPAKNVTNTGLIIYSEGDTKCLVDPSYIVIGEIDEDSFKDAIVTIFTMVGQRIPLKEHLILLNKNGKLTISKELVGEMKFLSISDRTIFIETSHVAPDSPFADCEVCKEIKKYKFIAGDTVRVK